MAFALRAKQAATAVPVALFNVLPVTLRATIPTSLTTKLTANAREQTRQVATSSALLVFFGISGAGTALLIRRPRRRALTISIHHMGKTLSGAQMAEYAIGLPLRMTSVPYLPCPKPKHSVISLRLRVIHLYYLLLNQVKCRRYHRRLGRRCSPAAPRVALRQSAPSLMTQILETWLPVEGKHQFIFKI